MPRKRTAIVAAMATELATLIGHVRPRRVNSVELFELPNAVVAIGGIGAKHGRRAAEVAIEQYDPQRLLAAGIAGAVSPSLRIGDVASVREVIDAAGGERYSTSNGGEWVLVTAANISNADEKRRLHAQYSADVVDMEGAAVAAVARQHGLEFAAIKSISDEAEFAMPPLDRFVRDDGQLAMGRLALSALLHPEWWGALARLRRNSKLASKNLCAAVEHLLEGK
jgi:purine-nucleoside phosphorylase